MITHSKLFKSLGKFATSAYANLTLIVLLSAFLIFWKSPHTAFADDGIYVAAGQRILDGSPIYIEGFRSGPFGAIILSLLAEVIPQNFAWLVFQVSYVFCMIGIVTILSRGTPVGQVMFTLVFAISCAPMRESLHNHQITALVVFMSIWPFFYFRHNLALKYLAVFSCSFAVDLKPQVAIFLVLALTLLHRNFILPFISFVFTLFSHGMISVFRGENVDLQWINFLLSLNQSSKWGESIFFWPLLEKFGISSEFLLICQQFCIVGLILFIFYSGLRGESSRCLVAVGLLTYFMSYSHFYDCLLIAVLAIIKSTVNPDLKSLLFMGFAIVPGEVIILQNFVFLMVMMLVYLLNIRSFQLFKLKQIIFIFLLTFAVHLFNNVTFANSDDQVRLRSTIYVFLALLALLDFLVLRRMVENLTRSVLTFLRQTIHQRGLRRRSDEFGRGFLEPRFGPLLSTTGVTYGIPDGSCAPVIRIKS